MGGTSWTVLVLKVGSTPTPEIRALDRSRRPLLDIALPTLLLLDARQLRALANGERRAIQLEGPVAGPGSTPDD